MLERIVIENPEAIRHILRTAKIYNCWSPETLEKVIFQNNF